MGTKWLIYVGLNLLFEQGGMNSISNYRPACLVCNFSKIFETILYQELNESVKSAVSMHHHGLCVKDRLYLIWLALVLAINLRY